MECCIIRSSMACAVCLARPIRFKTDSLHNAYCSSSGIAKEKMTHKQKEGENFNQSSKIHLHTHAYRKCNYNSIFYVPYDRIGLDWLGFDWIRMLRKAMFVYLSFCNITSITSITVVCIMMRPSVCFCFWHPWKSITISYCRSSSSIWLLI